MANDSVLNDEGCGKNGGGITVKVKCVIFPMLKYLTQFNAQTEVRFEESIHSTTGMKSFCFYR